MKISAFSPVRKDENSSENIQQSYGNFFLNGVLSYYCYFPSRTMAAVLSVPSRKFLSIL